MMISRDMAKVGYLYLQNGGWDSNQVISSEWTKKSTQKQTTIHFGQKEYPYGYQWWVGSHNGHFLFTAVGIGGQYIQVIPDLEIVIVTTSDSRDATPKHYGVATRHTIQSILK
jgi:CubicO group peptidase (beta-lactamase class C family)